MEPLYPRLSAFVEHHRTYGPLFGDMSVSGGSYLLTVACTRGPRLIKPVTAGQALVVPALLQAFNQHAIGEP